MLAFALTMFFGVTFVSVLNYKAERTTIKEIKVFAFSGGSGESYDPYIISSADDLRQLSSIVANGNRCADKYFELSQDIYMYGEEFLPIGFYRGDQADTSNTANDNLIFPFCGNFNGNNHTIYDLSFIDLGTLETWYYHSSSSGAGYSYCVGLFCVLSNGAYISNLRLDSPIYSISYNAHDGAISYGGIAGAYISSSTENSSTATITNCAVQNLTINDEFNYYKYSDGTYIGGIVGGKIGAGTLTIENCYAEGVSKSVTSASMAGIGPSLVDGPTAIKKCVYAKKSQSISLSISNGGSETNCKSTAEDVSGLDCSSIGNEDTNDSDYNTLWYYGGSDYNDGYPFLRQFISNWTNFWFEKDTSFVGDIDNRVICIPLFNPNGDDNKSKAINYLNLNLTNNRLLFFNQIVTATVDDGYTFTSWTDAGYSGANKVYKAMANPTLYTLRFGNATGVQSGDSISPSGTTYTVSYNTRITSSHYSGKGYLTLTYSFKNSDGEDCSVSYSIPEKYELVNTNNPGIITGPTSTVCPTVTIKTFNVEINVENGYMSYYDEDDNWIQLNSSSFEVNYGTSWSFNDEDEDYIYLGPVDIFPTDDTYTYDGIQILQDGEVVTSDVLTSITFDLEITIMFVKMHKVTFNKINNTTAPTSVQTIEVKENDSITATLSADQKTLTYSYNGSNVVYRASQYYILSNGSNTLKISSDKTIITPVTTFYACTVTMGNISSIIGTRTVTGDTYGTANDGTFVVEYGTTVDFAIDTTTGLFKYTYTFSSGEVVTYTITNEQYAMQYTLDSNGERTSISNGLNGTFNEDSHNFAAGTISKSISPTFGLKQYSGELG